MYQKPRPPISCGRETPDTRVATAYILNRVEDGEYGVAIAYGSILIVVMLAIIFIFDWLIGESRTSRSKAKNQA
ncbi:iron ABC transporter permease [Klebsiella pneumoniae]|nr:iron ABC transporter permease [Klebsiella pneumoniae]